MRNIPADAKVREGGGGGGPSSGADVPLQPMEKTIRKQIVPL